MTQYPDQRPPSEAAPIAHRPFQASPSSPPPADSPHPHTPPGLGPSGEVVRHILIGSPEGVRAAIYALHFKHYAEQAMWTGPMPIGPSGIHISRHHGEVMAYLTRLRAFDALR